MTAAFALACTEEPATKLFTRAELMDPAKCQSCHPKHYNDWSGSMHAYAAADPVFLAMNARAQRETNNELGDFCVKCHAPVAVREGLTTNGLNLQDLPDNVKGVTCYFCHSTVSADGDHGNPLALDTNGRIFGPISDPIAGAPHRSEYSPFLDSRRGESATACGSCHDIVNQHGAPIERTFHEWKSTVFGDPQFGATCAGCHMTGHDGIVATDSTVVRRVHNHSFPAVDVAITPFPLSEIQKTLVQQELDSVLQAGICLDELERKIEVSFDNVGAGHSWPSGATPDRRAWVAVTAESQGAVVFKSGGPVLDPYASEDPNLWVMRDCIYDKNGKEAHMFWDAASFVSNTIPGGVLPSLQDPSTFYRSHAKRIYPATGMLETSPDQIDKITVSVYLKPIGDDVLSDLVASKDLDPALAAAIPTFKLGAGASVEWNRSVAKRTVDRSRTDRILYCVIPPCTVTSTGLKCSGTYTTTPNTAASHAQCPPMPLPTQTMAPAVTSRFGG